MVKYRDVFYGLFLFKVLILRCLNKKNKNGMSKTETPLSDRKNEIFRNLCLSILLMVIALGQTPIFVSGGNIARPFIFVGILVLALLFIAGTFWNIYRLIPRLLLRGKYIAYVGVLFGVAVSFLLTSVLFEWATLRIYRIPAGNYGFFSDNRTLFFDILSNLICYVISLIATSLIVFLRYWWQSGERIHELEETGVHVELEKARTQIDSAALFDVLDKAASIVVSVPHEASQMLMELGKSLRRQLYESHRKQVFSPIAEKGKRAFREQNRLLNFLIEKRHRRARHLLLILAVCIIGMTNVDPRGSFPFLKFGSLVCVFLALIYFNIYVLLPRLLFKNRLTGYLAVVLVLLIGFIALLLPSDAAEEFKSVFLIFIISSVVQIGFIIVGTTAMVLFQHWARNERYIARLEAVTMRAELEQLQNQINPHFLFNMLNNILVLIRENPEEAVVILHKLSDMLKYQFNDSTKKEVLLKDDIHFLNDFLNLEKIRRDRFEFTITVENEAENKFVPPLLFIPFVENAVKHGNDAVSLSYIRLYFSVKDDKLHFTCNNSKPLKPNKKNEFSGLGLANIKRRLELLYDENHSLNIREDDTSYTVQLSVNV